MIKCSLCHCMDDCKYLKKFWFRNKSQCGHQWSGWWQGKQKQATCLTDGVLWSAQAGFPLLTLKCWRFCHIHQSSLTYEEAMMDSALALTFILFCQIFSNCILWSADYVILIPTDVAGNRCLKHSQNCRAILNVHLFVNFFLSVENSTNCLFPVLPQPYQLSVPLQ